MRIMDGMKGTSWQQRYSAAEIFTLRCKLLDKPGMLDQRSKAIVDHLIPDYHVLADTDYEYGVSDAYIGYATRGCPNKCSYCAVRALEPAFVGYTPLKQAVQ